MFANDNTNNRLRATCVAMALALFAGNVSAQDEPALESKPLSGPRLYAFTDTSSVRIEFLVPRSASLKGAAARGRIVSVADTTKVLWSGDLGVMTTDAEGNARLAAQVEKLKPRRWSPQSPALYLLQLTVGAPGTMESAARIGFRTMTAKNGQLLLNGRPIFLKGNAINPPERQIPDSLHENRKFVEPYVRYMKSIGVNIIRLTRHSQVWFDVCDEQGMMLFQGSYGTPKGGKPTAAPTIPFAQSLAWYKDDVLGPLVNHPSVVVYVLSNEQADREIGYLSTGADDVNSFLRSAYDSLSAWDPTRAYIANAGYGFGRTGDICDLHRYWGWYYNSFLSFYTMRYPTTCWRTSARQPMTMTENTGNYTGPDGRFNLVSNTKQPDSQLQWTGHAPENEQSKRALSYQAWMGGQAIEIYRRTREQNPNLAGLMPFTILFRNWHGIRRFEDMRPKPLAEQYRTSYQPVLLSWELWTSQVYAGSSIYPVAHIVNDDEQGRDMRGMTMAWSLKDSAGAEKLQGSTKIADVPYYAAKSTRVTVPLPITLPTGTYVLSGTLMSAGRVLSRNKTSLFVAGQAYRQRTTELSRQVVLYDPRGTTSLALKALGIAHIRAPKIEKLYPSSVLLIIAALSWNDTIAQDTSKLNRFVHDGGRMIILNQNAKAFNGQWLPVAIRVQSSELDHAQVFPGGRPARDGMAVNPERPDHPVFRGIERDRLFLWSDYSNWNETRPGFPEVLPVADGFVFTDPRTLEHASILANYDHGLEGVALAELFHGRGSILMSGLDVVSRVGIDPVSDRLFINMLQYMSSTDQHEPAPLVARRIKWGDYGSEQGLVTGIYNGLLLNTVPVVPKDLVTKYPLSVDAQGFWFAGGTSGWNTKPAIQYVAKGRRPFGPYTFTTGGAVSAEKGTPGEGRVWLRPPAGTRTMSTLVQNPVDETLEIEITVNGTTKRVRIPGRETRRVDSAFEPDEIQLAIAFRGDRRLVILETEFK